MAILDADSTTNANEHVKYGPDPKSFREARQTSESENQSKAEAEELLWHEVCAMWEVVKCTPSTQMLPSQWVYTKKRKGDGMVEKYKMRLVACGNKQVLGVNFLLIFAAVLKTGNFRVI